MDGIIVLKKEAGMTSFDCVSKLRHKLGIKKIGHTGTLDKEVSGVLVICVGKATKLVDILVDHKKTYECIIKLGIKTKTDDVFGEIIEEKVPTNHSNSEIDNVLESFIGTYNHSFNKNNNSLYVRIIKFHQCIHQVKLMEKSYINMHLKI